MEVTFDPELNYGDLVELCALAGEANFSLSFTSDHLAFDPLKLSDVDDYTSEDQLPLVQTQPLQIVFDTIGNWDVTATNPECSSVSHGTTAKRFGFEAGKCFTCKIEIKQEHFIIFLNGYSLTSSEHLVPVGSIRTLSIVGAGKIYSVVYGTPATISHCSERKYLKDCDSTFQANRRMNSAKISDNQVTELEKSSNINSIFALNRTKFLTSNNVSYNRSSHQSMPSLLSSYQLIFDLEKPITCELERNVCRYDIKSEQTLSKLDDPEFFIDGGVQMEDSSEGQTTVCCFEKPFHKQHLPNDQRITASKVTDQDLESDNNYNQSDNASATLSRCKHDSIFSETSNSHEVSSRYVGFNDKSKIQKESLNNFTNEAVKKREECKNGLQQKYFLSEDFKIKLLNGVDNNPNSIATSASKVPSRSFISCGHKIGCSFTTVDVRTIKLSKLQNNFKSVDFENTQNDSFNSKNIDLNRSMTTKRYQNIDAKKIQFENRNLQRSFPDVKGSLIDLERSNYLNEFSMITIPSVDNTQFASLAEPFNPVLAIDLIPEDQNWIFNAPCMRKECSNLSGTLSSVDSSVLDLTDACECDKHLSMNLSCSSIGPENQEEIESIHNILADESPQLSSESEVDHKNKMLENGFRPPKVDHSNVLNPCSNKQNEQPNNKTENNPFEQIKNGDMLILPDAENSALLNGCESLQSNDTLRMKHFIDCVACNNFIQYDLKNYKLIPLPNGHTSQHETFIAEDNEEKWEKVNKVLENNNKSSLNVAVTNDDLTCNTIKLKGCAADGEYNAVAGRFGPYQNAEQTHLDTNGIDLKHNGDDWYKQNITKYKKKNILAAKLFIKKPNDKVPAKDKQVTEGNYINGQSNSTQLVRKPSFRKFISSSRKWIDNKILHERK